MTKEACLNLGIKYIETYKCYPAAKGWTIATAGCSRDRIYKNWDSWSDFIAELCRTIDVPNNACKTTNIVKFKKSNLCKNCKKLIIDRNTYCNNKCQASYQNKQRVRSFLNNEYVGKPIKTSANSWLRVFLEEKLGNKCSECGIGNVYNNKPLMLEIDHIDGRCFNNRIENLRFLCPNCHSQTDTYKAKNKNSDNKKRYKK